MAKKISQLAQATQVKSDDVTVIVQDGETKKLPLSMMVTKQDIEDKKVAGLAKLDEIEATYENDTYTPTITVKNKSSVKVGEGDGVDYSANVMDGHVKSAILKGQTLVNLINYSTVSNSNGCTIIKNNDVITVTSQISKSWLRVYYNLNITHDKKYIVMWDSLEYTQTSSNGITNLIGIWGHSDDGGQYEVKAIKQGQTNNYLIFSIPNTSPINLSKVTVRIHATTDVAETGATTTIKGLKIMEYQEGMENWDIPYFEGMQSVKMPVLNTIGKNLIDFNKVEFEIGYIASGGDNISSSSDVRTKTFIPFNTVGNYTISNKNGNQTWLFAYDINKKFITRSVSTLSIPQNTAFIRVATRATTDLNQSLQLEAGTHATSYEPFKSNILSTPEEVVLRGIGDAKDELDLLSGELTQRIGEDVLDGSQGFTITGTPNQENTLCVLFHSFPKIRNGAVMSDKLITESNYDYSDFECITQNIHGIAIRLLRNKLESADINGVKKFLSQNPITVQYQLTTESIKTVDLMPSGTHPSTTPYCWKNGHIQLSSSGLLPNLEYSVVTSRAGQINQNATMIVKNDKRIFDLEILLAGGLVNTTYQALTLQNQVETGLSKVSLNSETEPDYLLYHMIMKLIEEKAYKLDDLTEKVSVFYLYEKLSDEQFETIYSALYPFVEDEIVEEPVVEELPEVVEDEVIM